MQPQWSSIDIIPDQGNFIPISTVGEGLTLLMVTHGTLQPQLGHSRPLSENSTCTRKHTYMYILLQWIFSWKPAMHMLILLLLPDPDLTQKSLITSYYFSKCLFQNTGTTQVLLLELEE